MKVFLATGLVICNLQQANAGGALQISSEMMKNILISADDIGT